MIQVQTVAIQGWSMTGRAEMALTQLRKGPASNLLAMAFVEWAGCPVLLKGHLQRNLEFQTEVEVSTSSTAHHLSTQTPGGEGFPEEPRGEGFPWSMWALDVSLCPAYLPCRYYPPVSLLSSHWPLQGHGDSLSNLYFIQWPQSPRLVVVVMK